MITEFRAKNFKSWARHQCKLRFAPLTGFFGANSSGKTSILQATASAEADRGASHAKWPSDGNEPLYFGDASSLVNLGSFDDVIHQH